MFVYLTTNLVNNKKYIGKYEGSESDLYIGSGKLLKRAVNKYGKHNFNRTILEKYLSKEECREGEKKWISLFDAVNSKEFYNIAAGGEGGNTFAGITGEDRVLLIAKLKGRKRAKPAKDVTSAFSVEEKKIIKVSIEEFINNNSLIGVASKGLYITPAGVFCSALVSIKHLGLKDYGTVIKRCLNNLTKVKKAHITGDSNLSINDLGKTFAETGWSFIKKEDITIEFLNNNKIIKN